MELFELVVLVLTSILAYRLIEAMYEGVRGYVSTRR